VLVVDNQITSTFIFDILYAQHSEEAFHRDSFKSSPIPICLAFSLLYYVVGLKRSKERMVIEGPGVE